MQIKRYAVRVSMFVFTFIYACVADAEYRHIKRYFMGEEIDRGIRAACAVKEASSSNRLDRKPAPTDIELAAEYRIANPTVPVSFKDVKYLHIAPQWYDPQRFNRNWTGAVAPGGYLYASGEHQLTWSAETPSTLAFESESANGRSYRFLGKARQWNSNRR